MHEGPVPSILPSSAHLFTASLSRLTCVQEDGEEAMAAAAPPPSAGYGSDGDDEQWMGDDEAPWLLEGDRDADGFETAKQRQQAGVQGRYQVDSSTGRGARTQQQEDAGGAGTMGFGRAMRLIKRYSWNAGGWLGALLGVVNSQLVIAIHLLTAEQPAVLQG